MEFIFYTFEGLKCREIPVLTIVKEKIKRLLSFSRTSYITAYITAVDCCMYNCCMLSGRCCMMLVYLMLVGWVFNLSGLLTSLGFLYLRGFGMFWGFLLFDLGFIFLFILLLCFGYFLAVFIFWNFLYFLAFFGFFCNFFSGLLLWFFSPKWVQLLKFSCNLFFLDYNGWRGCGDVLNVFKVFNRLGKYKKV